MTHHLPSYKSSDQLLSFFHYVDAIVEFSPVDYTGNENDGEIMFNVVLRTPTTRTVTVLFSTEPLTAMGMF